MKDYLNGGKTILITVDIEDWFHVENFKKNIKESQWENSEIRFEKNTQKLLKLFDTYKIKATFFVLGWCAGKKSSLVKEIQKLGHEVASHGYSHKLCNQISTNEFREDVYKSKCQLEDITGTAIVGYRSPSFSISDQGIEILKGVGYNYDSSYNSFSLNRRYGTISLSKYMRRSGLSYQDAEGFVELPVSNLSINNKVLPWGGGGYFRLYPWLLFQAGVSYCLKRHGGYLFYLHPWEIDPEQPRVKEANHLYKFRHYFNLSNCLNKLESLIRKNRDCLFPTCSEYLDRVAVKRSSSRSPGTR